MMLEITLAEYAWLIILLVVETLSGYPIYVHSRQRNSQIMLGMTLEKYYI